MDISISLSVFTSAEIRLHVAKDLHKQMRLEVAPIVGSLAWLHRLCGSKGKFKKNI